MSSQVIQNKAATDKIVNFILENYSAIEKWTAGKFANRFRSKLDAADLIQSVFAELFRRGVRDSLIRQNSDSVDLAEEKDDEKALWKITITIILRRVSNKVRHYQTAKRNVNQEEHIDAPIAIRNIEPIFEVEIDEFLCSIRERLTELEWEIFELHVQGFTQKQIAPMVQRSSKTIGRRLKVIRATTEELLESD